MVLRLRLLALAIATGISPRLEISQFAERANRWIKVIARIRVGFVAAKADRVAPTALKALQLPRIDRQVFIVGFEVVVAANKRTFFAVGILFAFSRWRNRWPCHDSTVQFI